MRSEFSDRLKQIIDDSSEEVEFLLSLRLGDKDGEPAEISGDLEAKHADALLIAAGLFAVAGCLDNLNLTLLNKE